MSDDVMFYFTHITSTDVYNFNKYNFFPAHKLFAKSSGKG